MRAFLVILIGAISGAVLTGIYGPRVIAYWFASPVRNSCDCTPSIEWAMNRLTWLQLGLTVGMAVLFFILDHAFFRRRKLTVTG
jgi:hypothetical protein